MSIMNMLQIQAVLSGVEIEVDTQSALQDAQEPAKRMHPRPGPAITVVAVDRDAQTDLHNAVKFQYTSLKPLRIFDEVIGKIVDVHPYAKITLGVLSCTAEVILAQVDRDAAVIKLLEKLCQVYCFIT
ncbi:hypothetical protein BDR07DRAFT_684754 [Suillus spraguei]|nr:hypothetical protein BDR07DRAFT_684754 [Suillus spraguei]